MANEAKRKKRTGIPKGFIIAFVCLLVLAAGFAFSGLVGGGYIDLSFLQQLGEQEEEETRPPYNDGVLVDIDGDGELVFIGDSLMVGATNKILELYPKATVDAEVGRFMDGGLNAAMRATYVKKMPKVVVVELATNINDNTLTAMEEMLFLLQDVKRVVFVTGYGTLRTPALAEKIRALPDYYGNVRVADWEAIAKEHSEYLAGDGIHLNGEAANAAFVDCISAAITAP
ncbi:MAG: hypothetical protein LBQ80_05900 [Clostridium sp.]|nr:hypothetical protein [Clostridium sp.]